MNINVYSPKFELIGVIDAVNSLIWTSRYRGYGDFEITLPLDSPFTKLLVPDNYLMLPEYDGVNGVGVVMIVEAFHTTQDVDEGDFYIASGRSLESLLTRRVGYNTHWFDGYLQEKLLRIINNEMGSGLLSNQNYRRIDEVMTVTSAEPNIAQIVGEKTYQQMEVYDIVMDICDEQEWGFKMRRDEDGKFVFQLYLGVERTRTQNEYDAIVFSTERDNVVTGDFFTNYTDHKNVLVVWANDELWYQGRIFTDALDTEHISGMKRREGVLEAQDLQRLYPGDPPVVIYTTNQHDRVRIDRGNNELTKLRPTNAFTGEVKPDGLHTYGIDYFIGDIVEFENRTGQKAQARLIEVTYSEENGIVRTFFSFETARYPNYEIADPYSIRYLIVGGGGGSGATANNACAGGGGGGGGWVEQGTYNVKRKETLNVFVGSGGLGGVGKRIPDAESNGRKGNSSMFASIIAEGGGGGGAGSLGNPGGAGGNGGGASWITSGVNPGGQATQGFPGGTGYPEDNRGASGGGGAGEAGQNGPPNFSAGDGGDGVISSIDGTTRYYGGGGGAGSSGHSNTHGGGAGGLGGGANGATGDGHPGIPGVDFLGGGAGGAARYDSVDEGVDGARGGAGVVKLRIPTDHYSAKYTGTVVVTTDGDYTILTFKSNGSYITH